MGEFIIAVAAFVSAVAAVISALKAGEAAAGVERIENSLRQDQKQAQRQAVYTGPIHNYGPVTQNVTTGGEIRGELRATEPTRLADETEVRWPQLAQPEAEYHDPGAGEE